MDLLLICGIVLAAVHTSHSVMPEYCNLRSDGGTGVDKEHFVYYDAVDGHCYPFIYNGEGGNQNRFKNEQECIRNCSAEAEARYPVDERTACHFPHLKGNEICRANVMRFYYDSVHDKCKSFIWKGCHGNGNRFLSAQMCNDTCDGIHDDGDRVEEFESDTPVALICGLVFGIIGAILIIAVIVMAVKSRNVPKKAPKKPKREESPLQDCNIEMA